VRKLEMTSWELMQGKVMKTILPLGHQTRNKFSLQEKLKNKRKKRKRRQPNISKFGIRKLQLRGCLSKG
jgi:hypothetical protein